MTRQQLVQMIDRIEKTVLVWTILLLAFIGFIQVFTRYIWGYSFSWYEELGRYLGVFIAFLGASLGVKNGSHFTMDLVVEALPPPWQQLVRGFTNTLCGLFFGTVVWHGMKIVLRMHTYGNTSPDMGLPMYLVYLPIPLFSLIMAFRFFATGSQAIWELYQPKQGERKR